ncbi:MAG: T9SS type A sorting domain-containing protein [Bacteroidetes bacterium]|nr:T9SS type A sorting domain-containing protein [Bacteroidota bacterium]
MIKKLLVAALLIGCQNFSQAQYCTPPVTALHTVDCNSGTVGYIDGVSITGTTLNTTATACSPGGTSWILYNSLSNHTCTLTKGSTYSFNISDAGGSQIISIWIDYDQNQSFDANEWTQVTTASTVGVVNSVSITIPNTASTGITGMRVRTRTATFANGSTDACTSFGSGETEDYFVTLTGSSSGTGCIATSQYPSTTITGPTTTGQNVVITDINVNCNYSGEFSVVTLTAGNYTLYSTTSTDIFTITDASNNILFNGVQPFSFTATAGTYRVHVFESSVCTTNSICRGVSITRNGAASTPPTITTTAITAITTTTATSGGNVTSAGSATVTARGVCYSTNANPTTADAILAGGSGTGSFVSNLSGLTAGTTYHVRAYATSTAGTSYGADQSFTTTSSLTGCISTTMYPQTVTAGPTANGQTVTIVTDQYAGEYYEINLVAGAFSAGSSVATDYLTVTTTTNTVIASGVNPVIFSVAAGTYRVHVFKNAACLTEAVSRTTTMTKLGIPTVTTTAATAITASTANSGGNVTNSGTSAVTARGVCYATTANPTIANSTVASGSGAGVFTANLTGLAMGTTYHIRAYATNASGTSYGSDLTFTTSTQALPSVTTTAVTGVTTSTANSGGNVTSIGGSAVTSRGICYATTTNPTLANTVISGGAGAGSFVSNMTGLNPNSTYYVRAYATNTAGTTYGSQVTFVTSNPTPPTVTTAASPLVSFFTATVGGNVTNAGTSAITSRGVCYSTFSSPTIANSFVSTGGSTGAFSVDLLGLSGSTTYHYRAYATNSVGTSYGADLTFTTLDPCVNSTEVYLTNMAFMDLATANATPTYYSTYVVPNAQGLPGLPATLNYNPLNPYNLVNPGLPVRMKVKSYNNKTNGTSVVSGLCKLRTTDPNITILDSTAGLNNVGWHNEAWSTDEFEFQVSYSVFTSYTAYVEVVIVEGANQYYTRCIPIPIRAFTVGQMDVDDDNNPDSNGNNNDLAEPSEIVEFLPYINNSSTFSASYVAGFVMNFDYLSNVAIWDNHIGSSGNVYAQGWWNYSFAQPQPIPAGTNGTLPEYDFVFDYTYPSTYRFDLHLMMAGGFNLLDAPNNITLMRTSTPLTFNANFPTIPPTGINAIATSNEINVFPNPFSNELSVRVKTGLEHAKYTITNPLGSIVASGYLEGTMTSINLEKLAAGLYNLTINGQSSIKISKK